MAGFVSMKPPTGELSAARIGVRGPTGPHAPVPADLGEGLDALTLPPVESGGQKSSKSVPPTQSWLPSA